MGEADAANEKKRSAEEYQIMATVVLQAAQVLEIVPLEDMLATVRRAESVGAILDPTAFREGMHKLAPQRRLFEAARAFRDAAKQAAEVLREKSGG